MDATRHPLEDRAGLRHSRLRGLSTTKSGHRQKQNTGPTILHLEVAVPRRSRAHRAGFALVEDATAAWRAIVARSRNTTEFIAMDPDYEDPFAPDPESSKRVECLHCDKAYAENEMVYGKKLGIDPDMAYWWCPTPGCDGKGFGFDVHVYGEMTGRK